MTERLQKVTGIVLKETTLNENDKIVQVLSKELGVIKIYAKGAMRLKNKFHSSIGIFTYSDFVVYKPANSDLYQLNEASVKHIFHGLSENIDFLSLAMYMSELTVEVTVPNDKNNDILRLFLNTLHIMTSKRWNVDMCKAAFEMRLMADIGFMPNIVGCCRCGSYEAETFYFIISKGEMYCQNCFHTAAELPQDVIKLKMPSVMALRYFILADLEQMFSFDLAKPYQLPVFKICEEYVLKQTGRFYNTLNFFKDIHVIGR